PEQTHEWILEPARPASGRVVDAHTGQPIEGARILMIGEDTQGYARMHSHESAASRLAITDAAGRFILASLHSQSRYALAAMAEGHCPGIVKEVMAGQQDILFRLDDALVIQGKVINIPDDQLNRRGQIGVYFRHRIQLSETLNDIIRPQKPLWLDPVDGVVNFQMECVWPLPLEISTTGVGIRIEEPQSTDDLIIDVAALQAERNQGASKAQVSVENLAERDVIIHLVTPEGSPVPQGALTVEHVRFEANPHWEGGLARISHTRQIPIDDQGRVRFTLKTPNNLELSPTGLKGFTFDQQWHFDGKFQRSRVDIEPGSEPFEASIALIRAGSIYGRVLEQDGSPAHSLLISVIPSKGIDIKTSAGGESDTHNRFHAGPLPLDTTYCIVAHRGYSYLVSDPVTLTPDEPFKQIELRFPQTHSLEVEVVDTSGQPVANMPVGLSFSPALGQGFGHSQSPVTNNHGILRLEGLVQQKTEKDTYTLKLDPSHEYQFQLHRFSQFDPGGRIHMVAQRGIVVSGQLIDTVTGKPMPQARVYALPAWENWYEDKTRYTSYVDADSVTDEQGRFRFSRLGKGPYNLGVSQGREVGNTKVLPGEIQTIELRARASDSFREKHLND
ncbi:MAG: carboxypeptidase regulatory-like domain-containing protein, partial [Phycisphaeraceae bacterium]|nr:carboxypeptidase regulatory-like domain-containing protein [Phycisphaeraceae bacterium]